MTTELIGDLETSNIRVSGKGLLYSLDLKARSEISSDSMGFHAEYQARFGPIKGSGTISTQYLPNADNSGIQEHSLAFDKLKMSESYTRRKNDFLYTKNGGKEKIVEAKPCIDSLALLFFISEINEAEDFDKKGLLLLGGKLRSFHFLKEKTKFWLSIDYEITLDGHVRGGFVEISSPKFKVKLKVEKT